VIVEVLMPRMSMTMTEATLIEWLVSPGEIVSQGQAIALIETDKVEQEIEAPAGGRLLSIEEPGIVYDVGFLIAEIEAG
jgi:pyruvate/2-oxoglutarate dehydrogenase complex dihydrolipoamide acyltransferase (E2) component